jgi:hypothetical protein
VFDSFSCQFSKKKEKKEQGQYLLSEVALQHRSNFQLPNPSDQRDEFISGLIPKFQVGAFNPRRRRTGRYVPDAACEHELSQVIFQKTRRTTVESHVLLLL